MINRINLIEEYKALNDMLQDMLQERNEKISGLSERVKELEQKNDRLKQEADFWRVEDREMMRLSHENKRYREALEFYAVSGQGIGEEKHGEVARKALEDESDG